MDLTRAYQPFYTDVYQLGTRGTIEAEANVARIPYIGFQDGFTPDYVVRVVAVRVSYGDQSWDDRLDVVFDGPIPALTDPIRAASYNRTATSKGTPVIGRVREFAAADVPTGDAPVPFNPLGTVNEDAVRDVRELNIIVDPYTSVGFIQPNASMVNVACSYIFVVQREYYGDLSPNPPPE